MTHLTIKIDEVTPEIQKTLNYLKTLSGVTISTHKEAQSRSRTAWETAIAEGAVSVDTFFDELNSRIDKYPSVRA